MIEILKIVMAILIGAIIMCLTSFIVGYPLILFFENTEMENENDEPKNKS